MKKYFSFFFVALFATISLTFTSCSSDDKEDLDVSTTEIIGTWKENSYGITTYMQYKSDGTYREVGIDDEDGDIDLIIGTWTLDGNELTIHNNEIFPITATIISVSSKELKLKVLGMTKTCKKVSDSTIEQYFK